jgi:HEAT repeat protein
LCGCLSGETQLSTWSALSRDWKVNWIVPWSLGEIGDKSAIPPLIETLGDNSPDMRVLATMLLKNSRRRKHCQNFALYSMMMKDSLRWPRHSCRSS